MRITPLEPPFIRLYGWLFDFETYICFGLQKQNVGRRRKFMPIFGTFMGPLYGCYRGVVGLSPKLVCVIKPTPSPNIVQNVTLIWLAVRKTTPIPPIRKINNKNVRRHQWGTKMALYLMSKSPNFMLVIFIILYGQNPDFCRYYYFFSFICTGAVLQ